MERRTAFEVRAAGRKLGGYAALFGTETRIADFIETVAPGAFAASLGEGRDILALADHDATKVLARTRSGTLRLSEDARGLAFELDLPDTQAGHDIEALAARGDLGGMSFGFTAAKDGEQWQGERRTLKRVTLHEISVVSAFPAYQGTTAALRARTPHLTAAKLWMHTL